MYIYINVPTATSNQTQTQPHMEYLQWASIFQYIDFCMSENCVCLHIQSSTQESTQQNLELKSTSEATDGYEV